jgi:hypothetical protein
MDQFATQNDVGNAKRTNDICDSNSQMAPNPFKCDNCSTFSRSRTGNQISEAQAGSQTRSMGIASVEFNGARSGGVAFPAPIIAARTRFSSGYNRHMTKLAGNIRGGRSAKNLAADDQAHSNTSARSNKNKITGGAPTTPSLRLVDSCRSRIILNNHWDLHAEPGSNWKVAPT